MPTSAFLLEPPTFHSISSFLPHLQKLAPAQVSRLAVNSHHRDHLPQLALPFLLPPRPTSHNHGFPSRRHLRNRAGQVRPHLVCMLPILSPTDSSRLVRLQSQLLLLLQSQSLTPSTSLIPPWHVPSPRPASTLTFPPPLILLHPRSEPADTVTVALESISAPSTRPRSCSRTCTRTRAWTQDAR